MDYFEYKSTAREAGISADELTAICRLMRHEFPQDDLLFELHVLRACLAVRDGRATLSEILRDESHSATH